MRALNRATTRPRSRPILGAAGLALAATATLTLGLGEPAAAAPEVQHAIISRANELHDIFGDQPVMHLLMPLVGVNRRLAVPEIPPAHATSP